MINIRRGRIRSEASHDWVIIKTVRGRIIVIMGWGEVQFPLHLLCYGLSPLL